MGRYVERHGLDQRALQDRADLQWTLSFSAPLQKQGPWLEYVASHQDAILEVSEQNVGRGPLGKLLLSRLPSLRVLSVVLCDKHAASCAVWEAVSSAQVRAACLDAQHPPPGRNTISLELRTGQKTTLFRRLGTDFIEQADNAPARKGRSPGRAPHPAPWARLERQFRIKLQGEGDVRKAGPKELKAVEQLERDLSPSGPPSSSLQVDDLQLYSTQVCFHGLRKHARFARIAYTMTATTKDLPGGRREPVDDVGRTKLVYRALLEWRLLATSEKHRDDWARQTFEEHISPHLAGGQKREVAGAQGGAKKYPREELLRLAEMLTKRSRTELHMLWATRWRNEDSKWQARLASVS